MKRLSLSLATPFAIAAILSLASVATIATTTQAQAYSCKSYPTQSVGVRKLKFKARVAARKNWQASVKSSLGLPWSLWSLAKNRSNTCVYLQNIKKWRCLASAKPCLYVVK